MILQNKLGINDQMELAKEEEKITKIKAIKLFETGILNSFEVGTFADMKGIDASYNYEGYSLFNTKDLKEEN